MFCGRPLSIAPWRAGKTTLPHSAKCHWHSLLRSVRRPPCLPLSGSDTRKQMITNRTPPAHSLPLSAYMRTGARQTFDSSPSPSLSPYMWFYKLWPLVRLHRRDRPLPAALAPSLSSLLLPCSALPGAPSVGPKRRSERRTDEGGKVAVASAVPRTTLAGL